MMSLLALLLSVTVMVAVMYRDLTAARTATAAKRGLEQRNAEQDTPVLVAVATGQYAIAQVLIEGGADIWAVNQFGLTVGRYAEVARAVPGSEDAEAREWLIAHLAAVGFPKPAPRSEDVLAAVAAKRWPPASARGGH
jgi:hypothetical protein